MSTNDPEQIAREWFSKQSPLSFLGDYHLPVLEAFVRDCWPEELRWTHEKPTVEGCYLMWLPGDENRPEFCAVKRDSSNVLRIYDGPDTKRAYEPVSDVIDSYLWFGPIPILSPAALSDVLQAATGRHCEHCGTQIIDDCCVCGSPQCCPKCCDETTKELLKPATPERKP